MKRRLGIVIAIICGCLLCMSAMGFAASVEVNLIDSVPQAVLDQMKATGVKSLKVMEMSEDDDSVYCLLKPENQVYGIAVAKVSKKPQMKTEVFSLYSTAELKDQGSIYSIHSGSSGTLWIKVSESDRGRFLKINGDGSIDTMNYGRIEKAKYGEDSFVWLESDVLKRWDGNRVRTFERIEGTLLDFISDGQAIYQIDDKGEVYREALNGGGPELWCSLSDFVPWQADWEFKLQSADLVQAGGTVYCAGAFEYHNDSLYINTGLLNLTAGTQLEPQSGEINYANQNGDGSLYLQTQEFYPSGLTPLNAPEYYELLLKEGIVIKTAIPNDKKAWNTRVRIYTDQTGAQWSFHQNDDSKADCVRMKADGSDVSYRWTIEADTQKIHTYFNGHPAVFDAEPYIQNSRTMVPIRGMASMMGMSVNWEEQNNTAVLLGEDMRMELKKNDRIAFVNGQPIELDQPMEMKNGRLMIPLRFVAEHLNSQVEWNSETGVITVNQ